MGESSGWECGDDEMLKPDLLVEDAESAVVLSELAGVAGFLELGGGVVSTFFVALSPSAIFSVPFLVLAGVVERMTVVASEALVGVTVSRPIFLVLAGVVESITVAASDSNLAPAGVTGSPTQSFLEFAGVAAAV